MFKLALELFLDRSANCFWEEVFVARFAVEDVTDYGLLVADVDFILA